MFAPPRFLALLGVLLLSLVVAPAVRAAYADPPGRVAYLSDTRGDVGYSPAGEDEWFDVVRNRPLIRGDRLWTGGNARAELQVGSAAFRLGPDTSVELLDIDDGIAQVRMTQGTLNLSVRRLYSGQVFEVATPMLAFTVERAGRYRIDVDPRSGVTTIVVWAGEGDAHGDNSRFPLRAGDAVRFYDSDLRDYEQYALPREDDFDRYSLDRDRRLQRAASLRYVDDDMAGYAELDEYGSWSSVSDYGNVWFPRRVSADWAPYRDGHWVWQEPWGWTWVDEAPWGFAPSHYGRWVHVSNRWGWVPGPRHVRHVYAPALVAFIGGSGWSVSISLGGGGGSPIGWFPIGPREVYVPSYQASRDYFQQVNVTNTVINNTTITNVYNNYSTGTINVDRARYANREIAGAVTAVPGNVFANAQPVRPAALRLDRNASTTGQITRVAPIAPSVRSVLGRGKARASRPAREAFDREVIVRNAPPPAERPFAARARQLQQHPGRAEEPGANNAARSRGDGKARNVRVIGDQPKAVDARKAGSRRDGDQRDSGSAKPGKMRPLDRSVEPVATPRSGAGNRAEDNREQTRQRDTQSQPQDVEKPRDERRQEVDVQSQEQRQHDAQQQSRQQQQAAEKQQSERKRQVEAQQEDQRQLDVQQQSRQQQQAAEKRQSESKRRAEAQQEEQRQHDVQQQSQQQLQAAEKQQSERKRQVEAQQEDQRQRDVQQQSRQQQHAAEKQQSERERQAEAPQPEQRQRDGQQQPQRQQQRSAQAPQAEQQRLERQAECERLAALNHADASKCQSEAPPDERRGDSTKEKDRRQERPE
jgi:DNA segregation ATPase FtsK/SpoIIIE-like protein